MGILYEEEYEEKLREHKQFGVAAEWALQGPDPKLNYPFPILHRPRLGTRWLVRQYVRRFIQALYKEVSDWQIENRARASHLLLYSIIYTEEFMVQFLDNLLVALYKTVLEREDKTIKKNVP